MLAKTILFLAVCCAAPALASDDAAPSVGAAPCIACSAPVVDPTALHSLEDWVALEDGAVMRDDRASDRADDDLVGETRAESLIPRPPAAVWAVLTDFEHWPEFMPLIDETRVDRRAGSHAWVEQHYRILLVPLEHTTIYDLAPGDGRLSWRLDEASPHDIAASRGEWALVPLREGRETLVRYDARVRSGRAVPEFVERLLRGRSLEQLLAGLRAEVLRRHPAN